MAASELTVGNVQIQALLDFGINMPLRMVFPNVAAEDWAPYRDLYPFAFSDDLMVSGVTAYLLRSNGRLILIDMGNGPGPDENFGGVRGQMLDSLAATGVAPADIDTVVLTHLHGDHIGWATIGDTPTFPTARVLLGEADWAWFSQPGNYAYESYQRLFLPLQGAGLIQTVSGEFAVTDELTMVPTPGHTPGHYSVLLRSGGQGAYFTGDAIHVPAQVSETDWSPEFDSDPDAAAEQRWNVVQKADVEGLFFIANHFPFPGYGKIARVDGRRSYIPLTSE